MDNVKKIMRSTVSGMAIKGVKKAEFLTLVNRPSNQRAFSVLRHDKEGGKVADQNVPRITRTKRSDLNPVQALVFPTGFTADQATESLTAYGMGTYVLEEADGVLMARRSDLQSIAKDELSSIRLDGAGVTALVQRAEAKPAEGKASIAVSNIEFDAEKVTREDAVEWLVKNGIDFTEEAIDNSSGNFVLKRMDVSEGEETRLMELEDGITAHIVRSDMQDIPEGYIEVISEKAYGGWGWGQLDFNARLADVAIGEALREGLYQLEDLLRDVMFYSPLPVDLRKELTIRALTQFGAYVTGLMDQLPRQLLMSVASTQRSDKAKEPEMTKATEVKEEVTTPEVKDAPLTREDVVAIVKEAMGTKEEAPAATEAPTTATPEATAPVATGLTRSDIIEAMAEVNKPLIERMEKLEGVTVVRSDTPDPVVEQEEEEGSVKRGDDLFAGCMPGLRR